MIDSAAMVDVASVRAGRGRLIAARVLTVLGVILAIVTTLTGHLRWPALDSGATTQAEFDAIRPKALA